MGKPQKIYFASDFHLGIPSYEKSLAREKKVVKWLDEVKQDATELFLVGDVFDFWFEYKRVIPKGFVRLQGKIAEITDSGIPVHYFIGNHDMWVFNYFEQELGVIMHREPITRTINGKELFIGHGDGLGSGDNGYKFIKKVFRNPVCQWLFERLHPNFGIGLALAWSKKSRGITAEPGFLGEEKEFLVQFCKDYLNKEHIDYFVFGHRHLPLDFELSATSRYINLGEWINHFTYGIFDGNKLELKSFNSAPSK